jgi:hypothetical protein
MRDGLNSSQHTMSNIMPRYPLSDGELAVLTTYLKHLSSEWSPGAADDTIQFATVVTPGIEPERRQVFLDMMKAIFAQKNANTVAGDKQAKGRRHMVTAAELVLGTERRWGLNVWELQGAPDTWAAQLEEKYRANPVFAVVSGLTNGTWAPVHDFCKKSEVPCWFPSVSLPPSTEDFYSIYFSRGVAVEASVLGQVLGDKDKPQPKRVIQVFRDDFEGRGAAEALKATLSGSGIAVEDLALKASASAELGRTIAKTTEHDAVVFWLRRADISALGKVSPGKAIPYFSAVLAGGEKAPFPAKWKARAKLIYPYDLPENRKANLWSFYTWLQQRKVPLVDEPMQAEVFYSLNFLTETIGEMLNNLYRDYLIDRAENMLSKSERSKAEQWERDREMLKRVARKRAGLPAEPGPTPGAHASTTIYPHMSLGLTQRFASKGAYIVHFGKNDTLVTDTDWIVP